MNRWALPGLVVMAVLAFGAGCATRRAAPAWDSSRLLRVGTVQVDAESRLVVVTGYVNQVEGAIELLACGPGGKVHESVLVLEVNPVDLQTALLLVGLQAGPPMPELGQGPPRGDRLDIWVQWPTATGLKVRPLQDLAYEWRRGRALTSDGWVFTGSLFVEGKFKALAEESLIASYWDPWAIVNVQSELGADDEALSVNRAVVPPLHTPVTLILEPR